MVERISICSSTHKHKQFLKGWYEGILCQLSSLDQGKYEIEICLVIDESTGKESRETEEYILNLQKESSRTVNSFKLHVNDKNEGCSAGMTKALKMSTGSVLGILETDDYYLPGKLLKSMRVLEDPDIGGVHTDIVALYPDGNRIDGYWKVLNVGQDQITTFKRLCIANAIYTCTFLAKEQWFRTAPTPLEFYNKFGILVDYPLFLYMVNRGCKIKYLEEPLSLYRAHIGVVTKRHNECVMGESLIKPWARGGCKEFR